MTPDQIARVERLRDELCPADGWEEHSLADWAKRWQQDDADALDALLREREALRVALDEARRLLSASLTLQAQSEDEADALRAERDRLRAALAGHEIP